MPLKGDYILGPFCFLHTASDKKLYGGLGITWVSTVLTIGGLSCISLSYPTYRRDKQQPRPQATPRYYQSLHSSSRQKQKCEVATVSSLVDQYLLATATVKGVMCALSMFDHRSRYGGLSSSIRCGWTQAFQKHKQHAPRLPQHVHTVDREIFVVKYFVGGLQRQNQMHEKFSMPNNYIAELLRPRIL